MDDGWTVEMLLTEATSLQRNFETSNDIRKEIKYKNYKNPLERTKHYVKLEYYRTKCTEFRSNTKKLWGMINKIAGKANDKSTVINCIKVDAIEHYDATGITNNLGKYFSSVGESYANSITNSSIPINIHINKMPQNQNSMFMTVTNKTEISRLISHLPNKTSSGYDCINNILLKKLKKYVVEPFCIIFNKCISKGKFPEKMKLADVIPLFKSKTALDPSNYRLISLLLTVSKLLEKIVYTRTYQFLTKTNQIYDSQYGFRSNHSCENALSELVENILKKTEFGEHTACVFLDLSKAFNTLKHDVFLLKLDRYGIRGLANDLSDRRVKYTVESTRKVEYSEEYSDNYGVPQGSCLGPLIFLIFNNDLARSLTKCNTILFADDTTLYCSNKNIMKLKHNLQHDLDRNI